MQRSFFKIVQKTVSSPILRFEHLGSETHKRKTHSQMLGKVEYGLPAKIWRLVGCTEMLS